MSVLAAKFIALIVVTAGSLIFGAIPAFFGLGQRYQRSTLLSSILCFGGGVLFATSIIHILPDVRNDLPKWSELIFCLGFLLIYLVDSSISFFNVKQDDCPSNEGSVTSNSSTSHYGTVDFGREPPFPTRGHSPCRKNECMNIGLLTAFTVHALLEGLVIGIQDTEYEVFLLLGAVCSHKLLVAFCLGAELVADGQPWQSLICPMGVFIVGSDIGIGIGMIFHVDGLTSVHTVVPLIEGLAGGTLLYIALCEIVPREKARKLPHFAPMVQFLALFIGFSFMSALTLLV